MRSECSAGCKPTAAVTTTSAGVGIKTGYNNNNYYCDSGGKEGSEKCDSRQEDNRFGDGNSEGPQHYVEGKKVRFCAAQVHEKVRETGVSKGA